MGSLISGSVAVVDRRPLVRVGVRAALEAHASRLPVSVVAASVVEFRRAGEPGQRGRTAVVLGQTAHPSPGAELDGLVSDGFRIVVLSDRPGVERASTAVTSFSVFAPASRLVDAVERAIGGAASDESTPSPQGGRDSVLRALTPREAFVLHLVALGMADKQIATEMSVGDATVKEYIKRIRRKYADAGRPAANRIELLRRAVEDGHLREGDS